MRKFSPGGFIGRTRYENVTFDDFGIYAPTADTVIDALSPGVDLSKALGVVPSRTRCGSCGSSEFASTGKCVYCRQYQTRGVEE